MFYRKWMKIFFFWFQLSKEVILKFLSTELPYWYVFSLYNHLMNGTPCGGNENGGCRLQVGTTHVLRPGSCQQAIPLLPKVWPGVVRNLECLLLFTNAATVVALQMQIPKTLSQ
jgi:hypothetical protein